MMGEVSALASSRSSPHSASNACRLPGEPRRVRFYCPSATFTFGMDGKRVSADIRDAGKVGGYPPTVRIDFDLDGDGALETLSGSEYTKWGLYTLRPKPRRLWRRLSSTGLKAGAVADLDGDKTPEAIAGTDSLYVYKKDMGPAWKTPYLWRGDTGGVVTCVTARDLTGDGRPEVIAGGRSCCLYVFNGKGKRLWLRTLGAAPLAVGAGDLDGDGQAEALTSTDEGGVFAYDAKGKAKGRCAPGGELAWLRILKGPSLVVVSREGDVSSLRLGDARQ